MMDQQRPKFISFILAIIFLKRLIKHLKMLRGQTLLTQYKRFRGKSSLKELIKKTNYDIKTVQCNVNIIPAIEVISVGTADDDYDLVKEINDFKLKRSKMIRSRIKMSSRGKGSLKAMKYIEKGFFQQGNKEARDMLEKSLNLASSYQYHSHLHHSGHDELALHHLLHKNKTIVDIDNHYVDNHMNDDYYKRPIDYLPGVSVAYGSSVAFKAIHGSYLCFDQDYNIHANAGRLIITTRFLIVNSKYQNEVGVVKYGDTITLKSGDYEALGSRFAQPDSTTAALSRGMIPVIVPLQKGNRMQPNVCWIIVNKDNPYESIGKPVLHSDKIMLSQEWFYLASNNKKNVRLYHYTSSRTAVKEYFNPGDESSWCISIIGLPNDGGKDVQKRLKSLHNATGIYSYIYL